MDKSRKLEASEE